jgi:hypothetical protein
MATHNPEPFALPPAGDPLDTDNVWPRPRRSLWYGIVGGPLAWAVQTTLGWLVEGVSCLGGRTDWTDATARESRLLQWVVVVFCLLIVGGALAVALTAWRAAGRDAATKIEAFGRPDFLTAVALVVSSMFLIAVLWTGLTQIFLPLCEVTR